MRSHRFAPGFRCSAVDIAVIVIATVASIALGGQIWWLGFLIAFVVAHFFLFCNVVRMARPLELIWAAVFVGLAAPTILTDQPGWIITTAVSLVTTAIVVAIELRKPSYHGLAWQQINPNLQSWWESNIAKNSDTAEIEQP